MKLTIKIKLLPDKEQSDFLKQIILTCNKACNFISDRAWTDKIFGQYNLQKLLYRTIKETFTLTAQVVIQCIVKVVDAYKLDKKTQKKFRGNCVKRIKNLKFFTYTF